LFSCFCRRAIDQGHAHSDRHVLLATLDEHADLFAEELKRAIGD